MKKLFSLIFVFAFLSCKQNKSSIKEKLPVTDTMTAAEEEYMVTVSSVQFDTANIKTSPIQVVKAYYGSRTKYDDERVIIEYKNVTNKTIEAIKFRWYMKDAFGEVLFLTNDILLDFGSGRTDNKVGSGATQEFTWKGLISGTPKHIKAWAYEVAFSDRTIWKITDK